jgi:hypothetical protein
MTHRPYPNPDRARRQLDRHDDETPPFIWAPRPLSQFERQFFEATSIARQALRPQLEAMSASLLAAFQRPAASEEQTA